MRIQKDKFSCGVFAVLNAGDALGVHLAERTVRKDAATTEADGTSQHGILNALERAGLKGTEFKITDKKAAFLLLLETVKAGAPVILSVENDRHWVVAFAVSGKKVAIFDSWLSQENQKECGTDVWDARSLAKWWTKTDGNYYGIAVEKA
jgi:ABC-type bacteriocin/lantibiotic exporter with double-glycine peptidase domain